MIRSSRPWMFLDSPAKVGSKMAAPMDKIHRRPIGPRRSYMNTAALCGFPDWGQAESCATTVASHDFLSGSLLLCKILAKFSHHTRPRHWHEEDDSQDAKGGSHRHCLLLLLVWRLARSGMSSGDKSCIWATQTKICKVICCIALVQLVKWYNFYHGAAYLQYKFV